MGDRTIKKHKQEAILLVTWGKDMTETEQIEGLLSSWQILRLDLGGSYKGVIMVH